MRERPEVFKKYDIRGKVPEEIDSDLVRDIGKALGVFWGPKDIVVSSDIRESSPKFYEAMIEGLTSQGCNVTKIGIATTDMTALITKKEFDAGVQITASHMPPSYGGIKPLNSDGRILKNSEMEEVKKIYLNEEEGRKQEGQVEKASKREEYIEDLKKRYESLFSDKISDLKVVIDSSNSVGDIGLPAALKSLGAEVITINSKYDPSFTIHSPKPSNTSSKELKDKVVEESADFGVILDGDADRAMFVDEKGQFIDGDTALAIFAEKYLQFSDKIVCSINTSRIVEDLTEEKGGEVIYAPVGAVFTALKCMETDAIFGGQPNGHLMDSEFVPYDSGSLFGLIMAGILVENKKTLSKLSRSFNKYERANFNIETQNKNEKMLKVRKKAASKNILEEEKFNGIEISFDDFNTFLRPSGSENKIRVRIEGESVTEKNVKTVKKFISSV